MFYLACAVRCCGEKIFCFFWKFIQCDTKKWFCSVRFDPQNFVGTVRFVRKLGAAKNKISIPSKLMIKVSKGWSIAHIIHIINIMRFPMRLYCGLENEIMWLLKCKKERKPRLERGISEDKAAKNISTNTYLSCYIKNHPNLLFHYFSSIISLFAVYFVLQYISIYIYNILTFFFEY